MRTGERHDAAVAQPDRLFGCARVRLFADGDEVVTIHNEAPVAGWIVRPKTQHNNGRAGRQWRAQFVQGFGANERRIAIDNENVVGLALERRPRRQHRMRGSAAFVLHKALRARQHAFCLGGDGILVCSDHDRDGGRLGSGDGAQHMRQQRTAGDGVQHFG